MIQKIFLVTGGNGYIGSHMCKLLYEMGHKVYVLDNFSTSPKYQTHRYGEFIRIDIGDYTKMVSLLESIKSIHQKNIEAVFHFAAKALVPEGESRPFFYYRENFNKTLNMLESLISTGIKRCIFSSTCATFGLPMKDKMDETHPQNPINTYGYTKLLMEKVIQDLAHKKLLQGLVFRYFNASGCDPDLEIGEFHEPETHLIPNLCHAYLTNENKQFELFGNDYETKDGTCVRDYIHVNDLVKVHYDGYVYAEKNPNESYLDFNLGSENGYSVKEVIDCFERITGYQLNVKQCSRRPGDPPSLVGDSQKAKKILNFKCQYSLEDAITHSLNLYKKHYSHKLNRRFKDLDQISTEL